MRAAFERTKTPSAQDPADLLKLFLTAKEIEGCSPRTIAYYRTTLAHMAQALAKPYTPGNERRPARLPRRIRAGMCGRQGHHRQYPPRHVELSDARIHTIGTYFPIME